MKEAIIDSQRLLIRKLHKRDLDDFHFYRSNPEVTKYQSFDIMSLEDAAHFIAAQEAVDFTIPGTWSQYGIEHKLENKIIGDCAIKLRLDEPRIAEVGITISHAYQKMGYAKEAM